MRYRKRGYLKHLLAGFALGLTIDVLDAAPWQNPSLDWDAFTDSALGAGFVGALIGAAAIWITNWRLARRIQP